MSDAMELKKYQEKAIMSEDGGLLAETLKTLDSGDRKLIVLKAFTGSGKTVLAGAYISRLLASDREERKRKKICVIWISRGSGGLHVQSGEKLKKIAGSMRINVHLIEQSSDFSGVERFNDNDIYVLNWEKLNKEGNALIAPKETSSMTSFPQAVSNSSDVTFILIIDEFHLNYNTDAYKEIVGYINPAVTIGMSATPPPLAADESDDKTIVSRTIPIEDVVKAQMIKKGVCFNTAADVDLKAAELADSSSIQEFFLHLALAKRDLLERKFKEIAENDPAKPEPVIPLLLIQFDDQKSNDDIKETKAILDEIYKDEPNAYAIWISEKDKALKKLRSEDSILKNLAHNNVKALLFKQAIATGWDCPRAHVLLRYRKIAASSKKEEPSSFDIQTIGRIMRTPERKHYDDDDLNYAYVFVPTKNYQLEKAFADAWGRSQDAFHKSEHFLSDGYESFENQSESPCDSANSGTSGSPETLDANTDVSADHVPEPATIEKRLDLAGCPGSNDRGPFKETLDKIEAALKGMNCRYEKATPSIDAIREYISGILMKSDIDKLDLASYQSGIEFDSRTLQSNSKIYAGGEFTQSKIGFGFTDTGHSLEVKAQSLLSILIDSKYYDPKVKDHLKKAIVNKFIACIKSDQSWFTDEETDNLHKLIIMNESFISKVIAKVDDFINRHSQYEFHACDYFFPNSIKVNSKRDMSSKNLYKAPLPESASKPEKIFERMLNESGKVKFWHKNADSGKNALCVQYEQQTQYVNGETGTITKPTFPDFIVAFDDGLFGIYEIKDAQDVAANILNKDVAIMKLANKTSKPGNIVRGKVVKIGAKNENDALEKILEIT